MTLPVVSGTAYHQLARTPFHRWWRPLLATSVLVNTYTLMLLLLIAATRAGTASGAPVDADGSSVVGTETDTVLLLAGLALALPAVLLTAAVAERRAPGTVASVAGHLRWQWLAISTLAAFALVVPAATLEIAVTATHTGSAPTTTPQDTTGSALAATVLLILLVPWQAAAEEYLFRGWLLQAAGTYLRGAWLPIGIQAVVFTAAHAPGTPSGPLAVLAFGLATGWLAVRTGGLEAGIALHTATNLTALLAAKATDQPGMPALHDAGWQSAALYITVVCLYLAVIAHLT